jgi:hypothetical protein
MTLIKVLFCLWHEKNGIKNKELAKKLTPVKNFVLSKDIPV